MDLSIIIITLNNKRILEQCIKSIHQYTKSVSYEIIVVDNNSTDGTQALVRSSYPKVTLVENRANLGFSRANNQGLKIAKGRYALILNDDTYIKEDAFGNIVNFMDENTEIGICGPRLLNPDGSLQRQGSIISTLKWRTDKPQEAPLVIGACMFVRMAAMKKFGNFDENLFFYNDDLDMCKRANKAGYKVVYAPIANVFHYGGYSSKRSANYTLMIEGFRGGLYFCKKHYGLISYHIYRGLLLLGVMLMLPVSLFNKAKFRAYMAVINIIVHQDIISKIAPL